MPDVLVRDLSSEAYETYKSRADAAGKSLNAQLREILEASAKPSREEIVERFREIRSRSRYGGVSSVDLIREDRDNDEPYR